MARTAVKRASASVEPVAAVLGPGPAGAAEQSAEEREAAWLAGLAASFCLFGLDLSGVEAAAWDEAADRSYRAGEMPVAPPANDARRAAAFPPLSRRGVHLPPAAPIRLIQAIDWVVVAAAAQYAALWGAGAGLERLSLGQACAFIAAAGALKAGLWITDAYRTTPARILPGQGLGGLALGAIMGLLAANLLAVDAKSAAAIAAVVPLAAMLLAGLHAALALWIAAAHRAGVFAETIVLVGATAAAKRIAARAVRSGETRIVAVAEDRAARAPGRIAGAPVAGSIDELLAWEGLPYVDRIVVAVTPKAEARVRDIIERLRRAPNRVDLLLDYDALAVRGRKAERFNGAAVACVSGRPHNLARAAVKRAFDLALGALLLALFAAPMLAIALAVRLDSKGPALTRERRWGFNNRVIEVLKFRTRHAKGGAPTRVGALLARRNLDDLPQLLNVLKGEMSLVGPRPHAIGMKAGQRDLQQIMAEYAHRHRVKPGVVDWAQINGARGPLNSAAEARRRVRLDLDYIARASLWLDLKILSCSALAAVGVRRKRA